MKRRERKNTFIKNNISRNIHPAGRDIKAFETFMKIVVPDEGTTFRPELKFLLLKGRKFGQQAQPKSLREE
jgi:hypothetical protein